MPFLEKNPNRENGLLELDGEAFTFRDFSLSLGKSGVTPLVEGRELKGDRADIWLGLGDGWRDAFGGSRVLASGPIPAPVDCFDSADSCLLCKPGGKLDMLLWMTGETCCRFMSGVPSRLGLIGRPGGADFCGEGDAFSKCANSGGRNTGADLSTSYVCDDLDLETDLELVDTAGTELESIRDGGLGGGTGIVDTLLFSLSLPPLSEARRVEVDEDEDSRTVESPGESMLPVASSVSFRDVDGLLRAGLCCPAPEPFLEAAESRTPGEWEDIEVGVEVMLKGPGEYPVDGVADNAYIGVGGNTSDDCAMY